MKNLQTFEEFLNESLLNEGLFKEDDLDHEVRGILTSDSKSMNAKNITSELPNKGFDRGVSVKQVEASLDRLIKNGFVRSINLAGKKEFIIESVNEAKKEKFLLYANPNNSTNRAYVAIGSDKVKEVMSSAKKYSGSYTILHQGNGTNDDLQKVIGMFSYYDFGDVSI